MPRRKKRKKQRHDELVGRKIGKLLVMRRLPDLKSGSKAIRARMVCQCDCGHRITVPRMYLRRRPDPKTSCGYCNKKLPVKIAARKTHYPEYTIWKMMQMRCYDQRHISYKLYGGLGIAVCPQWMDPQDGYETFLKDVGLRPTPDHSIDRINSSWDYTPDNVRWATNKEQARNKKDTRYGIHPLTGKEVPIAEIAEDLKIPYHEYRNILIAKGEW